MHKILSVFCEREKRLANLPTSAPFSLHEKTKIFVLSNVPCIESAKKHPSRRLCLNRAGDQVVFWASHCLVAQPIVENEPTVAFSHLHG